MLPVNQLYELASTLEGVPVLACVSGSPAREAGVRYGDIVLEANGRRVKNIDDYLQARDLIDDHLSLVLFRQGSELRIEMPLGRDWAPRRPVD